MIRLLCLVTSVLITLARTDSNCVINHASQENIWERKLHEDLDLNYSSSEPPLCNQTIDIYSWFVIEAYDIDSEQDEFTIRGELVLSWTDERLLWNRTQYDELSETTIQSILLWVPRLRQINTIGAQDEDIPFLTLCNVMFNGFVQCKLKVVFNAHCPVQLWNWPLDEQRCKLEFGAWKHDKAQVRFLFEKYLMYLEESIETHWTMRDMEYKEYNGTEVQTRLTYILSRQERTLVALLVVPGAALCVLSVCCFLLPAVCWRRTALCGFSLGCHYTCLSQLLLYLPRHGNDVPRLLYLYRGSFIVTVLLCVLHWKLRRLATRVGVAPCWVTALNEVVSRSRWGALLLYACKSSAQDVNSKDWTTFTNILNTTALLFTIIVYISLLIAFIPR